MPGRRVTSRWWPEWPEIIGETLVALAVYFILMGGLFALVASCTIAAYKISQLPVRAQAQPAGNSP